MLLLKGLSGYCVAESKLIVDCSNQCMRRRGRVEVRGPPRRGGHMQCLSTVDSAEVRTQSPFAAQKAACRLRLAQEATNHLAVQGKATGNDNLSKWHQHSIPTTQPHNCCPSSAFNSHASCALLLHVAKRYCPSLLKLCPCIRSV